MRLTNPRQLAAENASRGPPAFFESRTPTTSGRNATSTQLLPPLPPL
jgi:hypothetical protein